MQPALEDPFQSEYARLIICQEAKIPSTYLNYLQMEGIFFVFRYESLGHVARELSESNQRLACSLVALTRVGS